MRNCMASTNYFSATLTKLLNAEKIPDITDATTTELAIDEIPTEQAE